MEGKIIRVANILLELRDFELLQRKERSAAEAQPKELNHGWHGSHG